MVRALIRRWKNLSRLGRILQVVTKYGYGYIIDSKKWAKVYKMSGIPEPAPKPASPVLKEEPLARIRLLFEELGPTFIKLGQLLSTRPDLIPKELARELRHLQDRVPPIGQEEVRAQVKKELGALPEEIFSSFDYRPLASASIGQVHRACLRDGTQVVVKIQRPGLKELITGDLAVIEDLGGFFQHSFLNKVCDYKEILEAFSRQIRRELDFTSEAMNQEAFQKIYEPYPEIVVPGVYWEYTTQEILTMDFIPGAKLDTCEHWFQRSPLGPKAAKVLVKALFLPLFKEGIYHGDPHPGNVLFLPQGKIALLDFGIVGKMDQEFRFQIAQLMLAVERRDVGKALELTTQMGILTQPIDKQKLYEDLADLLDKTWRLNNPSINLGHLLNGMLEISLQHGIKMPGHFFTLGKAIVTGEGLAKRLDPQLNIIETVKPLAVEYLKSSFQPDLQPENFYRRTTELLQVLTQVPKDLARIIYNLAQGELSIVFVHRGLENLYHKLDVVSTRLSVSLIIGAGIAGSAVIIAQEVGPKIFGYSSLGLLGFALSSFFGIWMVWGMLRHGRLK